jgi:hypothetical protein
VAASVVTDYPVTAAVDLPPGGPELLQLCDGTRDIRALHAELQEAGAIAPDVTPANVAELVEVLLSIGALEGPACPVPRRPDALTH